MRMDKLTNPLQQALGEAQSLAVGRDHSMIEPAHLLSALINQSGSAILPLLQKAGANISVLHAGVDKALSKVAKLADSNGDVQGSQALGRLLNRADKLSQERGDAYISSDVVLLAMAEKNSALSALIRDAGLTEASLKKAIDDVRGGEAVQSADAEEQRQALEKYTVDLTARAEAGELDPLSRKSKPANSSPRPGFFAATLGYFSVLAHKVGPMVTIVRTTNTVRLSFLQALLRDATDQELH